MLLFLVDEAMARAHGRDAAHKAKFYFCRCIDTPCLNKKLAAPCTFRLLAFEEGFGFLQLGTDRLVIGLVLVHDAAHTAKFHFRRCTQRPSIDFFQTSARPPHSGSARWK
jgi:hypothetical protein